MTILKKPQDYNVLDGAKKRISTMFDSFDRLYVAFSGGKDSTVLFHLCAEEARKRNKKIGVLYIDMEAQYTETINHIKKMFNEYNDCIDVHWVCLQIKLRNALSCFEPIWYCWDIEKKSLWVRDLPEFDIKTEYSFFEKGMEFEEFMTLWGDWYAGEQKCCGFIGIRCDESLNRFRTIYDHGKETYNNLQWTTKVVNNLYNAYPLYDWKTKDIWLFHKKNKELAHNRIYDLMYEAGVPLSKQRLCQPFGDDQKQGIWLYQILEPKTWAKLVIRVQGANYGNLYMQESGNICGNREIFKPDNFTWQQFAYTLLKTLPIASKKHYADILAKYIDIWSNRDYSENIPDEVPKEIENRHLAPSWRMVCRMLLRNDWWGRSLGFTQPFSKTYGIVLQLRNAKKKGENEDTMD